MGGIEVQDHEIQHFSECIFDCGLQELKFKGPYLTWTNKTIWSRIDRAFVNSFWYTQFDYGQVTYLSNILSDHTSMLIETTACPKPQPVFRFCDMWTHDPEFLPLIKSLMPMKVHHPWQQLRSFIRRA